MAAADTSVEQFFEQWAADLGRALEMDTGKAPKVSMTAADAPPNDQLLWWLQTFTSDGTEFRFWTGTPESAWGVLGEAFGEGDGDACRSLYLQALNQAGLQTAQAAGGEGEVTCAGGQESGYPDGHQLRWMKVAFELGRAEPLQIHAVVEQAGLLGAVQPNGEDGDLASSPMLERLREVELPISIEVGSAQLTMREALGMTAGTVVCLNREIGETVALLVHDTVVATGEIVEVKGNYGLRIREIVSRFDRLRLCPD